MPDLFEEVGHLLGGVTHPDVAGAAATASVLALTPASSAFAPFILGLLPRRERRQHGLADFVQLPQHVWRQRPRRQNDLVLHDFDGANLARVVIEAPLHLPLRGVDRGQQQRNVVEAQNGSTGDERRGSRLQALHRRAHAKVLLRRHGAGGMAAEAHRVPPIGHSLHPGHLLRALAALTFAAASGVYGRGVLNDLPTDQEGLNRFQDLVGFLVPPSCVQGLSVFGAGERHVELPPAGTELVQAVGLRAHVTDHGIGVHLLVPTLIRQNCASLPSSLRLGLALEVVEEQLLLLVPVDPLGALPDHGLAEPLVVLLGVVPTSQLLGRVQQADSTSVVQALLLHDFNDLLLLFLLASSTRSPSGLEVYEKLVAEAATNQSPHQAHVLAEDLLVFGIRRELRLHKLLSPVDAEAHRGHHARDGGVAMAPRREQLHQARAEIDGFAHESLELLRDDVPIPCKSPHGLRPSWRTGLYPVAEEVPQHDGLRMPARIAPEPCIEGALQLLAVLLLVLDHKKARCAEGVSGCQPCHHGNGVAGALQHQAQVQQPAESELARKGHGDVAQRRNQCILKGSVDAAHIRELPDRRLHQGRRRRLDNLSEQFRRRGQVHLDALRNQTLFPHVVKLGGQLLGLQIQLGERCVQHLRRVELHHLRIEEAARDEANGPAGHRAAGSARALLAGGLRAPGRDEA
mmetsp:Transcript_36402/g.104683  ORF Transcript_36402/g.104683 Transcript_36402/m.104683 type:complete len:687 (-) Transcript_36402:905-2965(-)